MLEMQIQKYIKQIVLPKADSHKGQNGRVLVIGGSKLFHAAAFWSATMASKVVDLVHFSSPALENNELMRKKAKEKFWDGIVVPWEDVEHYIIEDDCILIGPGMPRDDGLMEGERPTGNIVNDFLRRYPDKRWVVDGGALQELEPELLGNSVIVTPNRREQEILTNTVPAGVTILAKGDTDIVYDGQDKVEIAGGNAGMTKGGTGDVLAGLTAALYAKSPAFAAAVVASKVNKRAGENLAQTVGLFFSASDLIPMVQIELAKLVKHSGNLSGVS